MNVLGKKWNFGQSGIIREKVFVIGQNGGNRSKMVVFEQSG